MPISQGPSRIDTEPTRWIDHEGERTTGAPSHYCRCIDYESLPPSHLLRPNAPMNGAGVRSTEASVPLAG